MAVVAKTDKMICSQCKVEMNHHCDKIVYAGADEAGKDRSGPGRNHRGISYLPQVWRWRLAPRLGYVAARRTSSSATNSFWNILLPVESHKP